MADLVAEEELPPAGAAPAAGPKRAIKGAKRQLESCYKESITLCRSTRRRKEAAPSADEEMGDAEAVRVRGRPRTHALTPCAPPPDARERACLQSDIWPRPPAQRCRRRRCWGSSKRAAAGMCARAHVPPPPLPSLRGSHAASA